MCDRLERGGAMSTNKAYARKNSVPKKLAVYFRLTVDIIFRMRNYSLIRWRDRKCIVDSEDLALVIERRAA